MSNGVHKTAIPCDCGCSAVLVWEFEPWGDEPHEIIVEISVTWWAGRLRNRLRAAWRVLRAKDPWMHSVVLQGEGIEQLRRAVGA